MFLHSLEKKGKHLNLYKIKFNINYNSYVVENFQLSFNT